VDKKIFESYLLLKNQFQDFDEMAVVAASAWDQRYRKIGKGQDSGFARQLNMASAQLSHIGWESGLLIETGTPTGSIGFVIQVAGDRRLRMNGQVLGRNQIALLHAPKAYDLLNAQNTTYMVLAVDAEQVLRHAQAHWGQLPVRLDAFSTFTVEANSQQGYLSSLMRQHLELAYAKPELLNDPGIQELLIDELLDAIFLSCSIPPAQKSPAKRHLAAKKAAQYIKDHVDETVTLRSMCEHTGTSERSLRQGFLERFGVTPKTYIKHFRLHQLRDRLRDPANEDATITESAARLGLTHLGRLPGEYKALFGELPSKTKPIIRL
jgi:AraC family ethanolamine operon transcriptional activator